MLTGKTCVRCKFAKKLIDDKKLEHLVTVLDVENDGGKALAERLGVRTLPVFIFKDEDSEVVEFDVMQAIKKLKGMYMNDVYKTTVIMISGKSNSGKGTVAEALKMYLEQYHSYNNRILKCSLSTCIRNIASEYFFWNGVDTVNSRKFMAEVYRLATELMDKYHMARGIWIRDIFPFTTNCQYKETLIIVESFREIQNWEFFVELMEKGFINKIITIRVDRPGADDATTDEELKAHVSEKDLDDFPFDIYFDNSGELEELPFRIAELACELGKKGI